MSAHFDCKSLILLQQLTGFGPLASVGTRAFKLVKIFVAQMPLAVVAILLIFVLVII